MHEDCSCCLVWDPRHAYACLSLSTKDFVAARGDLLQVVAQSIGLCIGDMDVKLAGEHFM